MPTIMISYRRDDSKGITGRIFDRLENYYGKDNVFMDIDNIPFGVDFREHLQQALERCDILLVIIGPSWLGAERHGRPALAEESDWVRMEVEAALAKRIPVIPVLLDRVPMPKATELPPTLHDFAFRNAANVDSGVDFRSHMERLLRSMDETLRARSEKPSARPRADSRRPIRPTATSREIGGTSRSGIGALPVARELQQGALLSDALRICRLATSSWIGIAGLLLVSELVAFLSEWTVADDKSFVLTLLAALALGVAGLISFGFRLFGYMKLHSDTAGVPLAALVLGVISVAAVPSFFHLTHRPDQYAITVAWPLVLLGGFGLVLIATILIGNCTDTTGRSRFVKAWIAFGTVLLALAWLDSNPTSSYLSTLGWRVRSVLIFTNIFVGSVIFIVLATYALVWLARDKSAASVDGR
jgi:hypothetical protein